MTNDQLEKVVRGYGIYEPKITFLRHNENRTYKVVDSAGKPYLLRIHQPLKDGMVGLQHTYEGLLGELEMLDALAQGSSLIAQSPLRNGDSGLITVIEHEGKLLNCSLMTWVEGRDLHKDDVNDRLIAKLLGTQIAELHTFFRVYRPNRLDKRPSQGISYNDGLLNRIKDGFKLGLFNASDVSTIEQTIQLINSRLQVNGHANDLWGIVHGDIGMGNIIVTPERQLVFIDFGFFGGGYYLLDVAMAASMVPSANREALLEGYFGQSGIDEDVMLLLEGFMLIGIIGYYAFQMGNESVHEWMRVRMPGLCVNHCLPFISGERIFYQL